MQRESANTAASAPLNASAAAEIQCHSPSRENLHSAGIGSACQLAPSPAETSSTELRVIGIVSPAARRRFECRYSDEQVAEVVRRHALCYALKSRIKFLGAADGYPKPLALCVFDPRHFPASSGLELWDWKAKAAR